MRNRTSRTIVVGLLVTGLVSIGSLAYASHSFTDVPDDHTFHNAIEWMKDAGITVGCNPPANTEYCPNENVTRGQMAAFFARAANSQAFDAGTLDGKDSTDFVQQGDPVGDADTLDGKDSTDFVQQGDSASDSDLLDGKDSSAFLGSTVNVREVTEAFGLLAAIDMTSECEAGEFPIGGGYEGTGGLTLNPTGNHPTDTGWQVTGTAAVAGSLTVYAICATTG